MCVCVSSWLARDSTSSLWMWKEDTSISSHCAKTPFVSQEMSTISKKWGLPMLKQVGLTSWVLYIPGGFLAGFLNHQEYQWQHSSRTQPTNHQCCAAMPFSHGWPPLQRLCVGAWRTFSTARIRGYTHYYGKLKNQASTGPILAWACNDWYWLIQSVPQIFKRFSNYIVRR